LASVGARVLKNFVWKICSNSLPTKDNLFRRKMVEDPLCPICKVATEDIWNMIWSCSALVAVW
jgi:hypothetical protein